MSDVATVPPVGTPGPTGGRPVTRSRRRSSPGRTGPGATPTRCSSSRSRPDSAGSGRWAGDVDGSLHAGLAMAREIAVVGVGGGLGQVGDGPDTVALGVDQQVEAGDVIDVERVGDRVGVDELHHMAAGPGPELLRLEPEAGAGRDDE